MRNRNLEVAWHWSVLFALALGTVAAGQTVDWSSPLHYLNTSFEHASPLYWEIGSDGAVHVYLIYDHERSSPNRANGHWFFEIQAVPGAELTFVLHNFDNVWNGRRGSPLDNRTIGFISEDARTWRVIRLETTKDNCLRFGVTVRTGSLYVARLEPYRLSDLETLKERIAANPNVEITTIGKTVEGRQLEIIRIGRVEAPHRVLLRARAHPWEPGGSWVVQGLVERLLRDDADARRCLRRYCVYVMPMANKDGVVRGWTRFNVLGADLNRQWDRPPDPRINPENQALETWLASMVQQGRAPHLMIDLHNDNSGKLHVSRPDIDLEEYLAKMARLETMLREHTWFTEGSTTASFRNPGSIGEGLLERFGIDACVLELNANWIAGLDDYPSAKNWQLLGAQLCEALYHYFKDSAS
ncbi:M14 family zinc carboxypeptidase [Anaerobaca lacustris]|uniref:M14 family zinc carboxypeptidase n=1 Tax=Anaerobaca lacustris TaxID=3044600 RepID=A0AAW6U035_9BACT|nr:M14 family zinc carboxypeptidase [Sedimentisphaerales bacterium M17dextr]